MTKPKDDENPHSRRGRGKTITDLLAMPAAAKIDFEPPRLTGKLQEPPDLG